MYYREPVKHLRLMASGYIMEQLAGLLNIMVIMKLPDINDIVTVLKNFLECLIRTTI